jgi:hypothetical protein
MAFQFGPAAGAAPAANPFGAAAAPAANPFGAPTAPAAKCGCVLISVSVFLVRQVWGSVP